MSAGDLIARLTEAKHKLESAQTAAASAAQALSDAEQQVAAALEGTSGRQLISRVSDAKTSLTASLAKIAPVKAEVEKAIQRVQAVGGGA